EAIVAEAEQLQADGDLGVVVASEQAGPSRGPAPSSGSCEYQRGHCLVGIQPPLGRHIRFAFGAAGSGREALLPTGALLAASPCRPCCIHLSASRSRRLAAGAR